jgi:hypothetical protein
MANAAGYSSIPLWIAVIIPPVLPVLSTFIALAVEELKLPGQNEHTRLIF